MPDIDLGGVLSAATEYGDDREAVARAEVQAQLDDALAEALQQTARASKAERERDEVLAAFEAYKAAHPDTPDPEPEPEPEPEPPAARKTIIGMSSPNKDWPTRLAQVGPEGITARRIFAWLSTDEQMDIVADAVKAGLMPVYSFKVSGLSTSNLATFDAKVDALMKKVGAALPKGATARITHHHEPNPDITGALFVAFNERIAPIIHKYPNLSFGPFLNGWLLDRQVDTFAEYTSKKLLAGGNGGWDWFGIDTYESGTMDSPGAIKPADRIPKLVKFVKDQGFPGKPLGVGEYNGYSAETIRACGEAILAEPSLGFGMMWNATVGKGYVLEGARLAAFKATKADPRAAK